jgi:hypothetical protein
MNDLNEIRIIQYALPSFYFNLFEAYAVDPHYVDVSPFALLSPFCPKNISCHKINHKHSYVSHVRAHFMH